MNKPKAVFIVSTGRSGSNMIAKSLAGHPEIFAVHEPKPHMLTEAFVTWKEKRSNEKVRKNIHYKRYDLIQQVSDNGFYYVESSHFCSHLIPILNEMFDAKFIHLYRDGRDFVRSSLERGWYDKSQFNKLSSIYLKKKIRQKYLLNIGLTWEDHRLDPPKKYKSRIEKLTWLWVEINTVILEYLQHLPMKNKMSIKVEDYNNSNVKKIFEIMNVNYNDIHCQNSMRVINKKPNRTIGRKVSSFSKWNKNDQDKFWGIANNMMDKLNYN